MSDNLDAAAVEISVSFDGQAMFRLDATGLLAAPDTACGRAAVALALAGASAALAEMPPVETREETMIAVVDALASIGTPEASAALDALTAATTGQTIALETATAVIAAATPAIH